MQVVDIQGDYDSLEEVHSQLCLLTLYGAHCHSFYTKIQDLLSGSNCVKQPQQRLQAVILPDMPFLQTLQYRSKMHAQMSVWAEMLMLFQAEAKRADTAFLHTCWPYGLGLHCNTLNSSRL